MLNCCNKQRLFNSDYLKDGRLIQNKHCQCCGTHWHDEVKYSAKDWNDYLNSNTECVLPSIRANLMREKRKPLNQITNERIDHASS